jgi:hypothetical protein
MENKMECLKNVVILTQINFKNDKERIDIIM